MTARKPHHPVVDQNVPPDHAGRPYCTCGIAIVDGDPRHTLPAAPADARQRAAGERGDEA